MANNETTPKGVNRNNYFSSSNTNISSPSSTNSSSGYVSGDDFVKEAGTQAGRILSQLKEEVYDSVVFTEGINNLLESHLIFLSSNHPFFVFNRY